MCLSVLSWRLVQASDVDAWDHHPDFDLQYMMAACDHDLEALQHKERALQQHQEPEPDVAQAAPPAVAAGGAGQVCPVAGWGRDTAGSQGLHADPVEWEAAWTSTGDLPLELLRHMPTPTCVLRPTHIVRCMREHMEAPEYLQRAVCSAASA